ncbi:DUF3179 domain-containing (seleno)protein [Paraflavitalea pollutisoli]|uniref:DUF3179 domain-containing (seleno)protein n=1 Tax=Paraflavitalea pollutisoli TaxID=3034143 RepID=UPI0023EBD747|nr:DUF3179 domain-containing (seleno)protein [Paraflavitalea sp. H1-2-19X]
MKTTLLVIGLLVGLAAEILRVYFIMPFPGSQQSNTIDIAYWLHQNIYWIRIVCLGMIAWPVLQVLRKSALWKKIALVIALVLYGTVAYLFTFRFMADKMFIMPKVNRFLHADLNKVPGDKLVIGVVAGGMAKAYPVQFIGYHHQVQDEVGGVPVLVTYCTVCRTGRVYIPIVDGRYEEFRLVGMDHFNAMFEDSTTKSWWRQVSGEAIIGPRKGKQLREVPSQQTTLSAWLQLHPDSWILEPDAQYNKQYEHLAGFDKGTIESGLEKRDSGSWKMKSWVVGITQGTAAKAYDWNELVAKRMIQDTIAGKPVLLTLQRDTASYHTLLPVLGDTTLQFSIRPGQDSLVDHGTGSVWDLAGNCTDGIYKGRQLRWVQSYQEFWHSWRTFHPSTTRYP